MDDCGQGHVRLARHHVLLLVETYSRRVDHKPQLVFRTAEGITCSNAGSVELQLKRRIGGCEYFMVVMCSEAGSKQLEPKRIDRASLIISISCDINCVLPWFPELLDCIAVDAMEEEILGSVGDAT